MKSIGQKTLHLVFVGVVALQICATPASAYDTSTNPSASTAVQDAAASMLKDMKVAVASDSSRHERQVVVHKLKQIVVNMTPDERMKLIDQLVVMVDLAMDNRLATVKKFEMPNFIVAMSALTLLLTLHPDRLVNTKSIGGLVVLGGAVYVQIEYLNPDNVELHAAQLRSELLGLRRAIEMKKAAGLLN